MLVLLALEVMQVELLAISQAVKFIIAVTMPMLLVEKILLVVYVAQVRHIIRLMKEK